MQLGHGVAAARCAVAPRCRGKALRALLLPQSTKSSIIVILSCFRDGPAALLHAPPRGRFYHSEVGQQGAAASQRIQQRGVEGGGPGGIEDGLQQQEGVEQQGKLGCRSKGGNRRVEQGVPAAGRSNRGWTGSSSALPPCCPAQAVPVLQTGQLGGDTGSPPVPPTARRHHAT